MAVPCFHFVPEARAPAARPASHLRSYGIHYQEEPFTGHVSDVFQKDAPPVAAPRTCVRAWGKEERGMETFEAVRTLLAVRQYQDRPIPEEAVQRIVEAAHLSASSMNLQPWHFIVVQEKETLAKLGELARTGPYTAQAALAVVVAIENTRFAVSDASRAIQSMMLTAWSEGIGSNWVGFGGLEAINPVLGVPADLEILAIIPFGYPANPVGRGKKARKPLGEVVRRERFDQPFS